MDLLAPQALTWKEPTCYLRLTTRELFGPTMEEWLKDASQGKLQRLAFLKHRLGLIEVPPDIRYQRFYRTASAIIEAIRFRARMAVMIVHSFSQKDMWFDDYQHFVMLYGAEAHGGKLVFLRETHGVKLYSGWAKGEWK